MIYATDLAGTKHHIVAAVEPKPESRLQCFPYVVFVRACDGRSSHPEVKVAETQWKKGKFHSEFQLKL